MNKDQEYPGMNGWVSLRLTPVGQESSSHTDVSRDDTLFETFYLTLRNGCLRWYTDEQQNMGRGCGYIVSKVLNADDAAATSNGNNALLPTQQQIAVSLSVSQLNNKKQQQSSSSNTKHNKHITFHILTKTGTYIMEVRCKAAKYWQSLLDLHFVQCCSKQSPSSIPSYDFEFSDAVFTSLQITNTVKIPIKQKGIAIDLTLSLFDNPEELTSQLMQQYQLTGLSTSKDIAISLLITLLQEQRKLFLQGIQKYQNFEKQHFLLNMEHLTLEKRCIDAEEHVQTLTESLQRMEDMLPILEEKLNEKNTSEVMTRTSLNNNPIMSLDEINDQNNQKVMSRVNSRTGLASLDVCTVGPHYQQQTRSGCSTPTGTTNNWKIKYDTIFQQLEETQELLKSNKNELKRLKKSKPLQQIESLTKENRQLREYSVQMRNEVISLQQQIEELQEAALATVEEMQQGYLPRNHGGNEESDDEGEYYDAAEVVDDHEDNGVIDIDLTKFALNPSTGNKQDGNSEWKIEDFITSATGPNYTNDDNNNAPYSYLDDPQSNRYHGNDHDDDDDSQDWTKKYQDFIDSQLSGQPIGDRGIQDGPDSSPGGSTSIASSRKVPSLLMKTVMKAMKWPLVEERILTMIYDYYSSGNKQGMTMTRFFRFAKDFLITAANATGGGGHGGMMDDSAIGGIHQTSSSSSSSDKLIYGEVSMIFTNASKLDTDDINPALLAPKVFKVRSNTYDVTMGNSNNPINAILSRNQFSLAIEALADRLYTGLVKQITGVYSENLTARERKQALRATLELLWIKTLVPCSIAQDLIPWSLVYLQELLVGLGNQKSLHSLLINKASVFVQTFSQACSENKQDLKKALKTCTNNPTARFVQELRMNFSTLTKVGKVYAIVPYLIGEHQYYSIFKEVACWIEKKDPKRYPIVKLPTAVQSALDNACETYYNEKLKSSSMILSIWSGEDTAALSKPSLSGKGGKKQIEELLTLENFILTLGAVAMQAFSSATSVAARMENLIQLLEKGNAISASSYSKKSVLR